jgi:hypothetical protein
MVNPFRRFVTAVVDAIGRFQTVQTIWIAIGSSAMTVVLGILQELPWAVTYALTFCVFTAGLVLSLEWQSYRRRRAAREHFIAVDLPELVVQAYSSLAFDLSGEGLPPSIYVVARNLRLTNRSKHRPVVLDMSLSVRCGASEQTYQRSLLSMPKQSATDPIPRTLSWALSEAPLDPQVVIPPESGTLGCALFSLPYPRGNRGNRDAELARLRQCHFSLVVHDTMSDRVVAYQVEKVVIKD